MVLTGRTALLALIAAVPIAVSPWPATTFAVCLLIVAALAGIDVALAGRLTDLEMQHHCAPSVRLGQAVDVALRIRNDGRRAMGGALRDGWPPSAVATPPTHRLALAPGRSITLTTRLAPVRRGDLHAAAVTVRSFGPLGLAGRQRSLVVPATVRVLPPFLSRKHLPSRLAKLRQIDGQTPVLIRGQGTEFDSLREYVVGDDVRSIDWRATARRADVVVRTWRPERDRRVVIVVDTGRTSAGRVGVDPTSLNPAGWPRLDWSLDAALLLAALASRAGDHVDFLAYDRTTRSAVAGARRTELLARLVEAMASVEPTLVESDAVGLVAEIRRRVPRRALVVLLTDLNPTSLDEGLLPLLPQLARHHQLIVGAVADPRVDEMAGHRGDVAEAYGAAAAERARADRRAAAAQLRIAGADVVDAAPEQLAPALADRYLALKASGRL